MRRWVRASMMIVAWWCPRRSEKSSTPITAGVGSCGVGRAINVFSSVLALIIWCRIAKSRAPAMPASVIAVASTMRCSARGPPLVAGGEPGDLLDECLLATVGVLAVQPSYRHVDDHEATADGLVGDVA